MTTGGQRSRLACHRQIWPHIAQIHLAHPLDAEGSDIAQLETIEQFGAVSMETAVEMAVGALEHSNAGASVAVTGIAGPGGGTDEKPVGLVYIAVANSFEEGAFGEEFRFGELSRNEIRNETVKMAFEMLMAYGLEVEEN